MRNTCTHKVSGSQNLCVLGKNKGSMMPKNINPGGLTATCRLQGATFDTFLVTFNIQRGRKKDENLLYWVYLKSQIFMNSYMFRRLSGINVFQKMFKKSKFFQGWTNSRFCLECWIYQQIANSNPIWCIQPVKV